MIDMKKSLRHSLSLATAFFCVVTQIFSLPLSYAAEAILDPNTGMPTATVDATTQTSTQTSTQTQSQTTSTEFLSQQSTLSNAAASDSSLAAIIEQLTTSQGQYEVRPNGIVTIGAKTFDVWTGSQRANGFLILIPQGNENLPIIHTGYLAGNAYPRILDRDLKTGEALLLGVGVNNIYVYNLEKTNPYYYQYTVRPQLVEVSWLPPASDGLVYNISDITSADVIGTKASLNHTSGLVFTFTIDGVNGSAEVTQAPSVPAGWTRAASDSTYAFKITKFSGTTGISYQKLETLNLLTGKSQLIAEVSSSGSTGITILEKVDISPDGKYVVYGDSIRAQNAIYVVDLETLERVVSFSIGYAPLETIEFVEGKIRVHVGIYNPIVGGYFEVNPAAQTYTYFPPVPDGWMRAASNPNFAFRRGITDPNHHYTLRLELMDLRNGQSQLLAARNVQMSGGGSETYASVMDVSPDGQYVAFETFDPGTARVQKIDNPDKQISISRRSIEGLDTISWTQDIPTSHAILKNRHATYTVALGPMTYETLISAPSVPQGWKRAASNPNFAFQKEYERVGTLYSKTLKLMNLKTGTVRVLAGALSSYSFVSDVYDVSPENTPGGPVVIYEDGDYNTSSTIHVQSVDTAVKGMTLSDKIFRQNFTLLSISFNENGMQAILRSRTDFLEGTVFEKESSIDLSNSPWPVTSTSRIVSQGSGLYIDPDTAIVLVTPPDNHITPSLAFAAWIYDASKGLDQLHLVGTLDLASDTSIKHTLRDVYTTPSGRRIISLGYDTPYFNATSLMDAADLTKKLGLDGAAASVTYNGSLATYTLVGQDGKTKQVVVDLETLQIGSLHSSPDGNYNLIQAGGFFILTEKSGKELGRIRVAGGLAHLNGFIVTNKAVYFAGESRSNLYFQFCLFSNFQQSGIQNVNLPQGVTAYGAGAVQFIPGAMPGVAEIEGSDFIVRQVDLEKRVILSVGPNLGKIVLDGFYGALPGGDVSFTWKYLRDAAGLFLGADIIVDVLPNQSNKPGILNNQFIKVRRIAGQWVIVEVQDRDFQQNLIAKNIFSYNENAKLTKITRTDKSGKLLSAIHVRRPAGKAPYYEIVTALGLKQNLNITMPLSTVFKKAAVLEAQKPAPPPPPKKPAAPAPPPSPLDLLKNLQNQLLGKLR